VLVELEALDVGALEALVAEALLVIVVVTSAVSVVTTVKLEAAVWKQAAVDNRMARTVANSRIFFICLHFIPETRSRCLCRL
jgi:hypothetical protein